MDRSGIVARSMRDAGVKDISDPVSWEQDSPKCQFGGTDYRYTFMSR